MKDHTKHAVKLRNLIYLVLSVWLHSKISENMNIRENNECKLHRVLLFLLLLFSKVLKGDIELGRVFIC